MAGLLVKFPSRSRPQLFQQTFRAYRQDETASFLISIDADDSAMVNPIMLAWLDDQPRTTVRIGNSKSKVEAVNDGLVEHPWDGVCVVASDDMVPQIPSYGARILELFDEFFPEGDGVLHLNDGRVGRKLNTLSILDRKFFDRFGYVYRGGADGYRSTHCDNEFQEVSERLGKAIYVDEVIIRHDWIGDTPDALHRRNESFHAADAETFRARKATGFPA